MYEYTATLKRVVDGDTVDLLVDVGFNITVTERFRLYGIDAPELRSKDIREKMAGLEVKQWLEDTLLDMNNFRILTRKKDKYGRWLVEIFNKDNVNINKYMVENNLADEYKLS